MLEKMYKIVDLQYFGEGLHFCQTINLETVCTLFVSPLVLKVAILIGLKGEPCLELKMKLQKSMVLTQKWHIDEICTISLKRFSLES